MNDISQNTIHRPIRILVQEQDQVDPTRTTTLRNNFVRRLSGKYRRLSAVIRKAIIDQDCFGLRPDSVTALQQLNPPPRNAFAFNRNRDKVEAFMQWLRQQIDKEILEVQVIQQVGGAVDEPWTNLYIKDSYKRGVLRARYEFKAAGFDIPTIDATGGIEVSMSTPTHVDRLGLLYTRVFEELKGITAAMDTQISRILAQGIADGDGPRLLAAKIIRTINGGNLGEFGITDTLGRFIPARRRATIMARTEIIRAHHQATITEYKNWAVEGVVVKAEWSTAGDNRVCSECAGLQGNVYNLDTIMNMIPVHPQCRCIALPFREGIDAATR
jgi:SPP1 gp7 family putative phage head morphogenesis protein